METDRRVVVTGMGTVCPLGRTVERLWENLLDGKSSVRDVSSEYKYFKDYHIKIGSLFTDFQISENVDIDKKELRRMGLFSKLSLDASDQAIRDSGILDYHPDETRERTGVSIGVGFGGIKELEAQAEVLIEKGMDRIDPFLISRVIPDAASGIIARQYQFHATECHAVVSACASAQSAIAGACKDIYLGDADIMITGGTEDGGSALGRACFGKLRALSSRNDNPNEASRPFDKDRDGFVMGEGSGILVLEELSHAKKRDARIYAELVGYGTTQDAHHSTRPRDDAKYTTKAIELALKRAKVNPDQVDYINAHGTSTPWNDPLESLAIRKALKGHAYNVPINSTKSMIGHTLGAAGALEAIVAIQTINHGLIHQTKNLIEKGPSIDPKKPELKCDLNYVMNGETVHSPVDIVLSNSFGFYGHNVVLAFRKYS